MTAAPAGERAGRREREARVEVVRRVVGALTVPESVLYVLRLVALVFRGA
jgi:hypothetical protein